MIFLNHKIANFLKQDKKKVSIIFGLIISLSNLYKGKTFLSTLNNDILKLQYENIRSDTSFNNNWIIF